MSWLTGTFDSSGTLSPPANCDHCIIYAKKNPNLLPGRSGILMILIFDGFNGTLSNADWNDVFDAAFFDINVIYQRYICYSSAGRSVLGETVPEALRTDLGRWITFLFFSYWVFKVAGKFCFSLQPMCVEVGPVRVDEARDRLQTKTENIYHNF